MSRKNTFTPYNPVKIERPLPAIEPVYSIFHYDAHKLEERKGAPEFECYQTSTLDITWINIDGLKKEVVEKICSFYRVHPLLVEDILSIGQRAKMDEVEDRIFCLLPMIYFNEQKNGIDIEQVSIVVGKDFLISFQEDASRDVFDPVREKLRNNNWRIRERSSDYLCYSLLDVIVDSYFGVIEKLGNSIEALEEKLIARTDQMAFTEISLLRREVMILKRSIQPVRELVNGMLRSDNKLVEERNEKYFKDVYDHITQANENCENLRDMLTNLQELYMNQINLRMNEVMKIFTMVSLLLAPATVIGGIFGMNFETIPLSHQKTGFYISVSVMFIIPALMLLYFKKKKWF